VNGVRAIDPIATDADGVVVGSVAPHDEKRRPEGRRSRSGATEY